ncbi:MAG: heat-inducible transcriptional repressor HrcA [Bacillota bacterium]|nr:heat-inducible transcriptional repressor HrcA [Bacillota bacterium]
MDLNERKLRILQAIISDFIHSAEPVGSRTLSRKYDMGISPATIRNEMSDLEEMGFLTHPHTSAGRVPSDKAYRLYVNNLMQHYELPEAEKQVIKEKLSANIQELDKTIEHAAHLLSELTSLTSFAITPRKDEDRLKYINILPVDENTVVLMIVAESGKVSNTALRMRDPYRADRLELLSKVLTYNYKGKTISDALTLDVIKDVKADIEAMSLLREAIMPNFLSTLEHMLDVELYMDGLSNIFSIPEYNDIERARLFLEMVNHRDRITDVLLNRDSGVMITIGDEHTDEVMRDCSLITATYRINGKLMGKLGVIGPTRMKYDKVTSIIEYMTENISNAFQLTEGEEENDE